MDSNWDAEKLNQGDLAGRVASIHLVAYTNAGNKGDEEVYLRPITGASFLNCRADDRLESI